MKKLVEWTPGHWWIVEVTGEDGSFTPIFELPTAWRVEHLLGGGVDIQVPSSYVHRFKGASR